MADQMTADELRHEIRMLGPDLYQLLTGWHEDGTAWSEWDESVRKRLAALLVRVDADHAARASQPAEDGAALIAAERKRQIEAEGWTPEHDDEHADGQMAIAAECYITDWYMKLCPDRWPWDAKWWKPGGQLRALVKAGALIAAEIDRLLRARLSAPGSEERNNAR